MRLLALKTAVPKNRYTQRDCYKIFLASEARKQLKERSSILMQKILMRDNGIEERRFCFPDIERIFDAGPEELNRVFEKEAPQLGVAALEKALRTADIEVNQLDGLIVCTCTGYLCPGLSSFIAELAGLRPDCELTDIVGMGCGAAIPALRQASHYVSARPEIKVAVIAVEVCSAAFYLDNDPGVIISACLFGDGAAASIWTGPPYSDDNWTASGFQSLHLPEKRQLLRFENAGGALRNRLAKTVPNEAAKAVRQLYERTMQRNPQLDTVRILPHTGGRDVLDALEDAFPGIKFPESRQVLSLNGNMSSPSILFVLNEFLNSESPERHLWLTSFGAGFSAYSLLLSRTGD